MSLGVVADGLLLVVGAPSLLTAICFSIADLARTLDTSVAEPDAGMLWAGVVTSVAAVAVIVLGALIPPFWLPCGADHTCRTDMALAGAAVVAFGASALMMSAPMFARGLRSADRANTSRVDVRPTVGGLAMTF